MEKGILKSNAVDALVNAGFKRYAVPSCDKEIQMRQQCVEKFIFICQNRVFAKNVQKL